MPCLDYEKDCKAVFAAKLMTDLTGKGRLESAAYHTAKHIYTQGLEHGGLIAGRLATAMQTAGMDGRGETLAELLEELRQVVK